MDKTSPREGQSPVGEKLTWLMMFLEASAGAVSRRFEAMLAGEVGPLQETSKELVELRKWAGLAYEEQARIEKLIRDQDGRVGDHEIDFADARAQIGRRLARLRAAGGAGDVSE
jgi:hypothetical protein